VCVTRPNAATCVKQVFDRIIHRGNKMKIEGGCYCGEVRYESNGDPASFARPDLDNPLSRMFCKTCGTALGTESPAMPAAIIIKVGTMDDPSFYSPQIAIFTKDRLSFHHVADGVASFDTVPG
jgi:hypothetical protein